MRNQILIYILFAACFFTACQSEYYDVKPEPDGAKDEISLTVDANDVVVSNGIASRAEHYGRSTIFNEGDCVGLIILDKEGNLLADNVPYKFDGAGWAFDADNEESKERVYYDGTMSTYIVYYPYHTSVNGIKSEEAIKELDTFIVQEDQHLEDDYRFSDLMIWSSSGIALRELPVELKHVRNSLSLDVRLRWDLGLPSDSELEYHPLRKALLDFVVRDDGDTLILNTQIDKTFAAQDGTYRYILPDKEKDRDVTWRYTYRGESYGGECTVSADATGVRYVQHTSAYISRDKAEAYDYYSYKKINDGIYGFVMPWDAVECFSQYNPVGIVFYVGQHSNDQSDYTDSGIGQQECHGYVVALSDAFNLNPSDPTKSNYLFRWANPYTPADSLLVTGKSDTNDWGGYENLVKMRNLTKSKVVEESFFPAEHACETYIGSDGKRGAAVNTSGWFLPTYNMLYHIMRETKFDTAYVNVMDYADSRIDSTLFDAISITGYWSSSESGLHNTQIIIPDDPTEDNDTIRYYYRAYYKSKPQASSATFMDKQTTKFVRPVLAF